MSLLNIGGDKSDMSYRYKMPALAAKIEGRGNGIKTVIVNMSDIAKALHVDPRYTTKYFGIEKGAQSTYIAKTERAVVNGSFTAGELQRVLEGFIQKFVLCPTCKLPELKWDVRKGQITIDCAACGHNSIMKSAHKLVTYIIKNPPGGVASTVDDRKAGAAATAADEEDEPIADTTESSTKEVEWFSDTSKGAQKLRQDAEFAEMKKERPSNKKIDDILALAKAEKDKDSSSKAESPVVLLKLFLASRERTNHEIAAEVRRIQLARGLDEPQRLKVLLEAVIDCSDPAQVVKQFVTNASLFKLYASDSASGKILLGCIEELCGVIQPRLLPRIGMILQALHDHEVLDEDVIISWFDAPPESSWLVNKDVATKVRAKAALFVNWLRESADGEGDDDDGDDQPVVTKKEKKDKKEKKEKKDKKKKSKDDNDDDVSEVTAGVEAVTITSKKDKKKKSKDVDNDNDDAAAEPVKKKKDKKKKSKDVDDAGDEAVEDDTGNGNEEETPKKKKDKKKSKQVDDAAGATGEEETPKKKKDKKKKSKDVDEEAVADGAGDEEEAPKEKKKKDKKKPKDVTTDDGAGNDEEEAPAEEKKKDKKKKKSKQVDDEATVDTAAAVDEEEAPKKKKDKKKKAAADGDENDDTKAVAVDDTAKKSKSRAKK